MVELNRKYLITLSAWIFGIDGNCYKSIYGEITAKSTYEGVVLITIDGSIKIREKNIIFAIESDNPPVIKEGFHENKERGTTVPNNNIMIIES